MNGNPKYCMISVQEYFDYSSCLSPIILDACMNSTFLNPTVRFACVDKKSWHFYNEKNGYMEGKFICCK